MAENLFQQQLLRAYRGAFTRIVDELNPTRHARDAESDEETRRFVQSMVRQEAEEKTRALEDAREPGSKFGGKLE